MNEEKISNEPKNNRTGNSKGVVSSSWLADFPKGSDGRGRIIYVRQVMDDVWLSIEPDYGFATLIRKGSIPSNRSEITLPHPIRSKKDLDALLKIVS